MFRIPFFNRKPSKQVHIALDQVQLDDSRKKFRYVKSFQCACVDSNGHNTAITIRSAKPRDEGPSNHQGIYTEALVRSLNLPPRYIGHSIIPSGDLNWNGLLEERGWDSNPVKCPACKRGISVEAYKAARRIGAIV